MLSAATSAQKTPCKPCVQRPGLYSLAEVGYPSICFVQGCESLIPGMKALIDRSTDLGVDSIVMGMPHRGELLPCYQGILSGFQRVLCDAWGSVPLFPLLPCLKHAQRLLPK